MTRWPVCSVSVAVSLPTTAGTPSSRATIAAWQVRPPRSVTIAPAVFITGSQSGLVALGHQHLAGLEVLQVVAASAITRTVPVAIFSPTALPVTSTLPSPFSA